MAFDKSKVLKDWLTEQYENYFLLVYIYICVCVCVCVCVRVCVCVCVILYEKI